MRQTTPTVTPETETEQLIRQAALKVFLEKGTFATSMKEIADEAGIKRTLLHYYFRNKEKLYAVVFSDVMGHIRERLNFINQSGRPIRERVEHFIDNYIDSTLEGANYEAFFMNEYNQNAEQMSRMLRNDGAFRVITSFIEEMNVAEANGELGISGRQLFVDLLALCMFPFAAQRMLTNMLDLTDEQYTALLHQRKAHLKKLFKSGLQV